MERGLERDMEEHGKQREEDLEREVDEKEEEEKKKKADDTLERGIRARSSI